MWNRFLYLAVITMAMASSFSNAHPVHVGFVEKNSFLFTREANSEDVRALYYKKSLDNDLLSKEEFLPAGFAVMCWRFTKDRYWTIGYVPREGRRVSRNSMPYIESLPPLSWTELQGTGGSHEIPTCPLLNMYFSQSAAGRKSPGIMFGDYLPSQAVAGGKLFLLADVAYPNVKNDQTGGLSITSFDVPDEEPLVRWRISVHVLKEGNDQRPKEFHWHFANQYDCTFSEPFFVVEQDGKHYFYVKSGRVFVVPSRDKAPKMKQVFTPKKEWAMAGLLVHSEKQRHVVLGWDAKQKRAEFAVLGDKLEVQPLELSRAPKDAYDLLYLGAKAMYATKPKGPAKE